MVRVFAPRARPLHSGCHTAVTCLRGGEEFRLDSSASENISMIKKGLSPTETDLLTVVIDGRHDRLVLESVRPRS